MKAPREAWTDRSAGPRSRGAVQRYKEIKEDVGLGGLAKRLGYDGPELKLRLSDDGCIAVIQPAPGQEKDHLVGTQVMLVTDTVPLAANICERRENDGQELNLGAGTRVYYPVALNAERVKNYDDCREVALQAMETIYSTNKNPVILKSMNKAVTHRLKIKDGESADTREDLSQEEVEGFKPPKPRQPAIGEVLAILYRDSRPRRKEVDWNYHYATVIAGSGNDLVTIENYRGRDKGRWYVQLYGQDKQSYDVQWASSGEFGRAALTYLFELEKLEQQVTLNTDWRNNLKGLGSEPTPRRGISLTTLAWGAGALVVVGIGLALRYYLDKK